MIINLSYSVEEEPTPTPTPTPTELVLYDAGEEASASGGWAAFAPAWAGQAAVKYEGETVAQLRTNPVGCSKGADELRIYWANPDSQGSWANGAFGTKSQVDLSGWSTLHVRATAAEAVGGTANYKVLGVTSSKTPPTDGTNTPPGTYATLGVGENTLDVSSLSGSLYVYFGGMLRSNAISGTADRHVRIVVSKVWLT